ncbi:MAG: hypothetical protein J5I90_13010 [Caldilineales bacterium]|nr:hypothetical protein [Caldilineales bacterium]
MRQFRIRFDLFVQSKSVFLFVVGALALMLAACQPAPPATVTGEHRQNLPLQQSQSGGGGSSAEISPLATPETEYRQNLPLQQTDSGDAVNAAATSPLPVPEGEKPPANADVEFVRARQNDSGSWTFEVTIRHPDTGWEDYADGWDVVLPDEMVVKPDPTSPFTRLLLHPHENEQPVVRSQGGIVIPDGVDHVIVRAHDLVSGWGGKIVVVDLTQKSGVGFVVER